jgi:hypothetical protein
MLPPVDAPESMSQHIDALCQQLAVLHGREDTMKVRHRQGQDMDPDRPYLIGEIIGVRWALALALGLDPEIESDKEGGADTYYQEWCERNGR